MASADRQSSLPQSCGDSVVRLTKLDEENGEMRFDKEALKDVLGQNGFEGHKVAIYSAIGQKRSGKSTFLTLFKRYADRLKIPDDQLVDDENELLPNTFEWKGGDRTVTKGVYISKHPIEVTTQDGKVALFLTDTPGIFDPDTSKQEQDLMGAITFLISSKQFVHVRKQIETAHLDLIYNCAKLAEEVREKDKICSSLQQQSLMFVVHDWETRGFELGFNGGKKHLENVTDGTERQAAEHKLRREYFEKVFAESSCFLVPPPKSAVRGMDESPQELLVKEFGRKFLTKVDELFMHILHPDQLQLKTIDGNVVKSDEFCNHVVFHAPRINDWRQLKECAEHVIVKAAMHKLRLLGRDLLTGFTAKLWKLMSATRQAKATHQSIFDSLSTEVMSQFDSRRETNVEMFVNKYRTAFKEILKKIFEAYKAGLKAEELFCEIKEDFEQILEKTRPKHRLMHKPDLKEAEKQLKEKAKKLKLDVSRLNAGISKQAYDYFLAAGKEKINEVDKKQTNEIKLRAAIGLAAVAGVASIAFPPLLIIEAEIVAYIALAGMGVGLLSNMTSVVLSSTIDESYKKNDNSNSFQVTLESDIKIPLMFGLVKLPVKASA